MENKKDFIEDIRRYGFADLAPFIKDITRLLPQFRRAKVKTLLDTGVFVTEGSFIKRSDFHIEKNPNIEIIRENAELREKLKEHEELRYKGFSLKELYSQLREVERINRQLNEKLSKKSPFAEVEIQL